MTNNTTILEDIVEVSNEDEEQGLPLKSQLNKRKKTPVVVPITVQLP